jgi:hypothetical protein
MTAPLTFITSHRIPDGKLDEVTALIREYTAFVTENEPDLVAFEASLNDDRTQFSLVHVHSSAESMDRHMQLAGGLVSAGTSLAPTTSIAVFGEPGPMARTAMARNAEAGVPVHAFTDHVDGHVRVSDQ